MGHEELGPRAIVGSEGSGGPTVYVEDQRELCASGRVCGLEERGFDLAAVEAFVAEDFSVGERDVVPGFGLEVADLTGCAGGWL